MTWKELRAAIEAAGVKDDDQVVFDTETLADANKYLEFVEVTESGILMGTENETTPAYIWLKEVEGEV